MTFYPGDLIECQSFCWVPSQWPQVDVAIPDIRVVSGPEVGLVVPEAADNVAVGLLAEGVGVDGDVWEGGVVG